MIEVDLRAVWRVRSGRDECELDQMLIALLDGIAQSGKLTHSARLARISYRHAWNLIENWGAFLGSPLVQMRRGKGTKLTPLGERLLWAGRRVQSRLAPELEGLAGDFTREVNRALGVPDRALVVHASHDFAVALLRERLAARGLAMDLQNRGSFDALASLLRGDCVVAGFHVADGPLGSLLARRYAEGLAGSDLRFIPLATRRQGLIVARGNPKGIHRVADLACPGIRIVNRQRGSGTRALFEFLLSKAGVDRNAIRGYDNEEITHSAVAALVAGCQADAGFGLEAAASRFGLDFVPVATERYYLGIEAPNLGRRDVRALLDATRDPGIAAAIDALPGYACRAGEKLLTLSALFGGEAVPAKP